MNKFTGFPTILVRLFLSLSFLLAVTAGIASPAAAKDFPGAVYTLSNAVSGNAVLAYSRASDGSLIFQAAYPTGGNGSGASLGSQGAVVLNDDNHWLLAVNAGSNEISVFAVKDSGLVWMDNTPSGGSLPVSVTIRDHTVYVLNEGGSGNISGFRLEDHGMLNPIAGSTQNLSNGGVGAAPGGAEVSFSPDGKTLVVTEKGTNLIDTFAVDHGIAAPAVTHASSGPTPYGFDFNQRGTLVVSEAFGGASGASALSSYNLKDNQFSLVSPSVKTTQTAACWVQISKNGKYAYTTNAGSASISSYRIGDDGSLTLINATAALTGAGAVDMTFSADGKYLYNLNSGAHSISAYRMQSDGSLVSLGMTSVPAGVAGLAGR